MPKINEKNNIFYWIYMFGFFIILSLPILVFPPWFYPVDWGKTIIFRSVIAVMLFLFAWQFFFRKWELPLPSLRKNKISLILLSFFVITIISTLFSQDINFSLWGSPYRAEGAVTLFFYIIFPILAFLIVKPSDWIKLLNFSIFIGIPVCLIAFIQFYGLFNNIFYSVSDRPPSTMGNPIMLGIYLLVLSFIALPLLIKEKRLNYKIFYSICLLFFLTGILISGSRAAYLGLFFGGAYFFLFYPDRKNKKETDNINQQPTATPFFKKISTYKIFFVIVILLSLFSIYYINYQKSFPQFIEGNKIFQAVKSRLSFDTVIRDPRISAWKVVTKEITEKPILGWGPENLAIGFDKYYDPSLPFISKEWGGWWDRAHNIVLDTMATLGIPATILYLSLFVIVFWLLQRVKNDKNYQIKTGESPVIYHGIQAALVAYFVANLFSFDGFSTYLLFYLLIGYSTHLTYTTTTEQQANHRKKTVGSIIIGASALVLIIFIWQYNFLPMQINAQIVRADNFANAGKCDQAFLIENKILSQHSYLDAYMTMHYIEVIKKCAGISPMKDLELAKSGIKLMEEAIKIRPLYSRLWIYLGSFKTIVANSEQDQTKKDSLLSEARHDLEKAGQLAPKHQEVLVEQAKIDMVDGEYVNMKEKSIKCISLDQNMGECYWIKALSEIYLKENLQSEIDIKLAEENRFDTSSVSSLNQLVNAYAVTNNFSELAIIYKKLIDINYNIPEYHSSLAFTYYQMKNYKLAREEAMIFYKLMPEAKEEVDAFLNTLPY